MFIREIEKEILEVLGELAKAPDIIKISFEAEFELDRVLDCHSMEREGYLTHCALTLASERIKNEKEIRQLKDEVETLKREMNKQSEIISTYNGSYLQRTKVKSGVKIAKKNTVTKEAIQQLKGQNLTINQIANKLGCSRTTVWRRLNG